MVVTAGQNTASVANLRQNDSKTIVGFANYQLASKFLSMGILPGSKVKVIRVAPLSGGFYIRVNQQNFAIRTTEAASILVN